METTRRTAFAVAAAATLAIGAAAPALAADYAWTFQTSEQAGEPGFEIKKEWATTVGKMSGERIAIEVLPTGAIVPHNQTLDAVGAGILQGHLTDPSYFSGIDPAFSMMGNLVGAWGDPTEFLEFLKYGGGEELYNQLVETYGVHNIGAAASGLEAFVSKKPIRTVDDLKGLKVRAPEGMVYDIFSKAGATPVNLPGSEVYTGLEKGVIDAADYTVFSANQAQGLHSFAKYPNYPGFHSLPMVAVDINKQIWDELPEDLKEVLNVSIDRLALDYAFKTKALDIAAVQEARKDKSIEIVDMAPEERKKFRAIAEEEWKDWAGRNEMTQKYYDAAVKFLKERNLL